MEQSLKDHVTELEMAENNLVQVLLSKFLLHKTGNGSHLHISFNRKTPAIRRRESKSVIKKSIPDFERKSLKFQKQLDSIILDHESDKFELSKRDKFFFRYASGGVLPIIAMDGEEYYCLFYRDAFPIGWNIANGGCDSLEELLDPLHTMLRELQEELMIFDHNEKTEYIFSFMDRDQADLLEFKKARLLWQSLFPANNIENYKQIKKEVQWIDGPDCISIQYDQGQPRNISNCFININAVDFGIEIDKIAKFSVGKGICIMDGELINNQLLRSPIGLFNTKKISSVESRHNYYPDKIFYEGIERNVSEFETIMNKEFWPRLLDSRNPIRNKSAKTSWDKGKFKYQLCPVTRSLIHRYINFINLPSLSSIKEITYDVFISHASKDEESVRKIIEDFKSKGISYWVDHEQITFTDFITEKIEDGLLRSRLILICLSRNFVQSQWCRKEYSSILNKMIGGNEKNKIICLQIDDIKKESIPVLLSDLRRANYSDRKSYNIFLNDIIYSRKS